MLVLTRKEGEEIILPALGVTIRVVNIREKKVRLAFDAHKSVVIHRRELLDQIREQRGVRWRV